MRERRAFVAVNGLLLDVAYVVGDTLLERLPEWHLGLQGAARLYLVSATLLLLLLAMVRKHHIGGGGAGIAESLGFRVPRDWSMAVFVVAVLPGLFMPFFMGLLAAGAFSVDAPNPAAPLLMGACSTLLLAYLYLRTLRRPPARAALGPGVRRALEWLVVPPTTLLAGFTISQISHGIGEYLIAGSPFATFLVVLYVYVPLRYLAERAAGFSWVSVPFFVFSTMVVAQSHWPSAVPDAFEVLVPREHVTPRPSPFQQPRGAPQLRGPFTPRVPVVTTPDPHLMEARTLPRPEQIDPSLLFPQQPLPPRNTYVPPSQPNATFTMPPPGAAQPPPLPQPRRPIDPTLVSPSLPDPYGPSFQPPALPSAPMPPTPMPTTPTTPAPRGHAPPPMPTFPSAPVAPQPPMHPMP